jgi:hypothetical protein
VAKRLYTTIGFPATNSALSWAEEALSEEA